MNKKLTDIIDIRYPYRSDVTYITGEHEEFDDDFIPIFDVKNERIFFPRENDDFIVVSFENVKSIRINATKTILTDDGEVGIYNLCIEYFGNEKFEMEGLFINTQGMKNE